MAFHEVDESPRNIIEIASLFVHGNQVPNQNLRLCHEERYPPFTPADLCAFLWNKRTRYSFGDEVNRCRQVVGVKENDGVDVIFCEEALDLVSEILAGLSDDEGDLREYIEACGVLAVQGEDVGVI